MISTGLVHPDLTSLQSYQIILPSLLEPPEIQNVSPSNYLQSLVESADTLPHDDEKELFEINIRLQVQEVQVIEDALIRLQEKIVPIYPPFIFLNNKGELLHVIHNYLYY